MKTAIGATTADFDSLYRTHHSDIHRFVFHFVQDAALADELTQDTFLKAHEAWGSFRGDAPERIWLLRIARNICLDYLRSPRARTRRTASLEERQEEGREPGGDADAIAGRSVAGDEQELGHGRAQGVSDRVHHTLCSLE